MHLYKILNLPVNTSVRLSIRQSVSQAFLKYSGNLKLKTWNGWGTHRKHSLLGILFHSFNQCIRTVWGGSCSTFMHIDCL